LAVGDFDSISNEQMEMLKLVAKEIHVLPAEKDDTDTQVALLLAMKKFPEASSFRIFGATGGRIDHFLSNLFLPLEERFASIAEKIEFHNEKNVVKFFGKGTHRWFKNVEMKYLGFANLTPVEKFTILDAKYTLPSTNITQLFAYPSNEFLGNKVHFSLEKGLIVGVQSKD
jgi:thiamine pyrophosphokinase